MALIKAIRKGSTAVFSEKVWKTGQPQRYGWVEVGAPMDGKKTLPSEILEFAEIRKGKRNAERDEVDSNASSMEEKPTIGEIIAESADVVREAGHVVKEGAEFIKDKTPANALDVAKEAKELVKEAKEVKELIEKRKAAKTTEKVVRKTARNEKKSRKTKKNDNPKP